jgi:hypothetical protein
VADRQPEPSLPPVVVPVRAGDIARVQRAGAAASAGAERYRRAGHERRRDRKRRRDREHVADLKCHGDHGRRRPDGSAREPR